MIQNFNSNNLIFRAPELIQKQSLLKQNNQSTLKADIWSLGVIFYFIVSNQLPVDKFSKGNIFSFFENPKNFFTFKLSILELILIENMLKNNAKDRKPLKEIFLLLENILKSLTL